MTQRSSAHPLLACAAVGSLLLIACPGNTPQLAPDAASTGGGGTGGQDGCAPSPRLAGVCARGPAGVECALSNGSTGFLPKTIWAPELSDAAGWSSPARFKTIRFVDLDGDGDADLCARFADGIHCGLNGGTDLGPPPLPLWTDAFGDTTCADPVCYETIQYADVNGDGLMDVCGRQSNGMWCGLSNGAAFEPITLWSSELDDASGWDDPDWYETILFPDLNGDKRADVCGRSAAGLVCALSTGGAFANVAVWSDLFADSNGWDQPKGRTTIRFPNVNPEDEMADVCARAGQGIFCGLSTGIAFTPYLQWQGQFADEFGWTSPGNYLTIRFPDVDGDRRPDLCARAVGGLTCARNIGSSFDDNTLWATEFSDPKWSTSALYRTIQYPDLDGDGRADVCGRAPEGMRCGIALPTGIFSTSLWTSDFSDAQGFGDPSSYATLQTPVLQAGTVCP